MRSSSIGLAAALMMVGLIAAPASATVGCSFDTSTGVVTVTTDANGDSPITISTDTAATRQITVAGATCGATADKADVNDTSQILVNNTATASRNQTVAISLVNGDFAPGKADASEPVGSDHEIEFVLSLGVGIDTITVTGHNTNADNLSFGQSGNTYTANLNAAESVDDCDDVTWAADSATADGFSTINGGGGADTIVANGTEGCSGSVTRALALNGDAGDDTIKGGSGVDTINGGTENDTLTGNGGGDSFNGGTTGTDTVTYSNSTSGLTINAATPASSTGDALNDSFAGIDVITGTSFNDIITGLTTAETLNGGDGDDTLDGGTGVDTENGGAGFDTFNQGTVTNGGDTLVGGADEDVTDYSLRTAAITVTLDGTTTGNDGLAAEADKVDTEDVMGSNTAIDTLTGDTGRNILDGGTGGSIADILDGGGGRDFLIGGPGGDTLTGGGGRDTAVYSSSTLEVTVDLTIVAPTAQAGAGDATGDKLSSVVNVIGSDAGNDVLTGDGNGNTLNGGGGTDDLTGAAGADTLLGRAGADTLRGGTGNDDLSPGAGTDTDVIIGGAGERDTVDYSQCTTGVTVDLTNGGTGSEGGGNGLADATGNQATGCGSDDLTTIDNVRGTAFTDTLTGDGQINALFGLGASNGSDTDTLVGGAGGDVLNGGRGNDTLNGGDGGDLIKGGAGADTAHGDAHDDVVQGGDGDDILYGDGGTDDLDGEAGTNDKCDGETEANCEANPP